MSFTPSPTILTPHLPPKTLVGIDLVTFTSTPNFLGIRDLPDGWHFIYTGTTESLSIRCGAWFYIGPDNNNNHHHHHKSNLDGAVVSPSVGPDVLIWKWSPETEALVSLSASDAERQEAMRYKANLGAAWQAGALFRYRSRVPLSSWARGGRNAGPGPVEGEEEMDEENEEEGRRDWEGLTDRLSAGLLGRIVGEGRKEEDVDGRPRWVLTSASAAKRDSDDIEGLGGVPEAKNEAQDEMTRAEAEHETELAFLPVELKRTWREGAVGRERTEAAQDRSWALGDLIDRVSSSSGSRQAGEAQVLGEMQFTFLMCLTLMNYSCLQQWKRLLELILTCRGAIKERETFMRDALRLLLLQLKRCGDLEGGLFDLDGEEGGEFLRKLLMKFRKSVYEVVDGVGPAIKAEFEQIEAFVKEEYDWELNREAFVRRGMLQLEDGEEVEMEVNENDGDDETGEYAPMVVDLEGQE